MDRGLPVFSSPFPLIPPSCFPPSSSSPLPTELFPAHKDQLISAHCQTQLFRRPPIDPTLYHWTSVFSLLPVSFLRFCVYIYCCKKKRHQEASGDPGRERSKCQTGSGVEKQHALALTSDLGVHEDCGLLFL